MSKIIVSDLASDRSKLTKEQIRDMEVKLYPRCLDLEQRKPPAYSAAGYILPCCWADTANWDGYEKLVQEHLHISNVKDVDEILFSDEWDEFFHNLIENPKLAPRVCKVKCCTKMSFKSKLKVR